MQLFEVRALCVGQQKIRVLRPRHVGVVVVGAAGDVTGDLVRWTLGLALMQREAPTDRRRGLEVVTLQRDTWLRERSRLYMVPGADMAVAQEAARCGERDGALKVMRRALNHMFHRGTLATAAWGTELLAEALLDRSATGDVAEAQSAIGRLARIPLDEGWVVPDTTLLRLRALLARARGDDVAYRDLADRYRATAISHGFEGHIARAEAMR